jgi:outer membrane protein assembly factor BamB
MPFPISPPPIRATTLATSICAAALLGLSHTAAAPPDVKDHGPKEPAKSAKFEGKVVLAPVWKASTIRPDSEDLNAELYEAAQCWVTGHFTEALTHRQASGKPVIPPAVPAGTGDLVIYVTERSIAARTVRSTKLLGEPTKPGELAWEGMGDGGLVELARDLGSRTLAADWLKRHGKDSVTEILLHRTLSTALVVRDGEVHIVDELALVPPDSYVRGGSFGAFTAAVKSNDIRVWDIETGKLFARFPDIYRATRAERSAPERLTLGPPLVDQTRWYFLEDRGGQLAVQCRDWHEHAKHFLSSAAERDKASRIWETELFRAPQPVTRDPRRRIHAIHLVRSGSLVLCPTHLGYVVALNAKTGKMEWFFEYAPVTAKRFETFAPEWVVVPPVVVGDRYVYAPADFPELLCLDVANGKKVWSVKKGDGLYPAVAGDRVLVVGEKSVRALSLKDGTDQWKLDLPGLPCGRGAILGDTYLVPVSEPKTWRGMIAVVDLKAGKIAEVLKPEKDEPIGNLVVHQEFLISQTLTEIAVFPIKKRE